MNAVGIAQDILGAEETPDSASAALYAGKQEPAEAGKTDLEATVKRTLETIREALKAHATKQRPAIAVSGGTDSLVLLDLVAGETADAPTFLRPVVVHADSQMEYPETREFIAGQAARFELDFRIARADRTPLEQWRASGWPMLGKLAARLWTQKHLDSRGFRLNVSECCRAMKITPARRLTRNIGCSLQFTGQRGDVDDALRGLRTIKDGTVFKQTRDGLWIANPLEGWTDAEILAYTASRQLELHPAKARGAKTIGCVFCGGGSQYTNSGYRILRRTWPEAWRAFMVGWGGGRIILALKYDVGLETVKEALKYTGGLERLAEDRPWVFDFTRRTPMPGYER